jgi:hypothetical protein
MSIFWNRPLDVVLIRYRADVDLPAEAQPLGVSYVGLAFGFVLSSAQPYTTVRS